MWSQETSVESIAAPARIWALFADVAGWPRWNAGAERIALHGPFADGSTFVMQLPGGHSVTSTLSGVREGIGFRDVTEFDGCCVQVEHRIEPRREGCTRVVYRVDVDGPAAADIGPRVTADFPQVLAALKQLAECGD